MRGKVTADAYSGRRCVWGELTMHDDDWEVTRLASLQPERAEKIGWQWICRITLLGVNYTIGRYGIALGGDSDARRVTSQWRLRVGGNHSEVRGQIRGSGLWQESHRHLLLSHISRNFPLRKNQEKTCPSLR
jgi:hypothetical protein